MRTPLRLLSLCSVLTLIGLTAAPAHAQFVGPGAQDPPSTVQAILDNPTDDQVVTLQGHLAKQVSDEKYLFQDDSAGIRVEIDSELMRTHRITPDMTIEIQGEVETSFLKSPEIDVEQLRVVDASSS
jgi:uncharacterized protein (TIGR00156 family)